MVQVSMRSRVGVSGRNGAGKSTLLNLLAGELMPLDENGDVGALWRHQQLRVAYIAQQHFFHLAENHDVTPLHYIQSRFAGGWDMETQRRLVLSDAEEAVQYRKCMAEKYGGRPYIWSEHRKVWMGREVEALLGRRIHGREFLYKVSWRRLPGESTADIPDTYEPARKLRSLGVEMLCLAVDSRLAYADLANQQMRAVDIVKHLRPFGFSEDMTTRQSIGCFSVGQKSKLLLGAAMWVKPHVLLIDEPTNFLDSQTVRALKGAIRGFQGGCVVASHCEDFLNELCDERWRIEDGLVVSHGKHGIIERLAAKRRRMKEEQAAAMCALGPAVRWEMPLEDVGRVLDAGAVAAAFHRFAGVGASVPEDVVTCIIEVFVQTVAERRPATSDDWLGVVIAAFVTLDTLGFDGMADINYFAPIAVALLRSLLVARAVGSTDGGEALVFDQVHGLWRRARQHRWREVAAVLEECCYCGQSLDPRRLGEHERQCVMSPSRCGRKLESGLFEMFHGTSPEAAAAIERGGFKPSVSGMLGPGVYCSRDRRKALRYGKVVFLLQVHLGRVIKTDRPQHPLRLIWQTPMGGLFDCAWVPPRCGVVPSGLEENCVRSPSQITVMRRLHWDEDAVY